MLTPLFHISLVAILTPALIFVCSSNGNCVDRCGDVEIPFPFGTSEDCYMEEKYLIKCNDSTAFLRHSDIVVTNISLFDGELIVTQYLAKDCYDSYGSLCMSTYGPSIWLSNFTISATKNKFVAVGCDTKAIVTGYRGERWYTTGCISSCDEFDGDKDSFLESCSGVGCCKTSIPRGLQNISVSLSSYYNHSFIWEFDPCSFAFVVEETKFNFSSKSFKELKELEKLPLVLDWSIGEAPCEIAQTLGNFTCKGNSMCVNSNSGYGYLCRCLQGYEGNPYHPDGCQDIDECKTMKNPCINGQCQNLQGNWTCICSKGYKLDTTGTGCTKVTEDDQRAFFLRIGLGAAIGLIALLITSFLICWRVKEKEVIKLREKFFEQNGGVMLLQQLSSQLSQEESQSTKIFTEEELKRATNNFHESKIVGRGGYGIVYKGTLPNNRVVAIKMSKLGVQTETEQFVNEVMVLLQLNHRNVVRLLGCCLETEAPLLVYDFISNGTLSEHIHEKSQDINPLSWELRVKIAAETAGVLTYLHSECSTQIIHRDVKTTNILLDEHYTAKVSDFGASRLIPLNKSQVTTLVQGTLGYLDPEYFQTGQLTEKSDVYSFGVVLAELLTGKKAVSFDRPENDRNLAMLFISSMNEDSLLQILDRDIIKEEKMGEIKEVAKLATMCLRVKGQERPTMKEVAMELEGLRIMEKHPWRETNSLCLEENEYLLGATPLVNSFGIEIGSEIGCNRTASGGCSNSQNHILIPYNDGR